VSPEESATCSSACGLRERNRIDPFVPRPAIERVAPAARQTIESTQRVQYVPPAIEHRHHAKVLEHWQKIAGRRQYHFFGSQPEQNLGHGIFPVATARSEGPHKQAWLAIPKGLTAAG